MRKTTFLRTVLGLLPLAGRVDRRAGPRFAYVPQAEEMNLLWPLTVKDVVELPARAKRWGGRVAAADARRVGEALARAGVEPIADQLLREVSGGQRQRTALAQALAQAPDVYLLDEPTKGLDVVAGADLLGLVAGLSEGGQTVFLVSHSLHIPLNLSKRILLFHQGAVISSTAEEIYRSKRLEEVYGVPFVYGTKRAPVGCARGADEFPGIAVHADRIRRGSLRGHGPVRHRDFLGDAERGLFRVGGLATGGPGRRGGSCSGSSCGRERFLLVLRRGGVDGPGLSVAFPKNLGGQLGGDPLCPGRGLAVLVLSKSPRGESRALGVFLEIFCPWEPWKCGKRGTVHFNPGGAGVVVSPLGLAGLRPRGRGSGGSSGGAVERDLPRLLRGGAHALHPYLWGLALSPISSCRRRRGSCRCSGHGPW
ncbi:MAG: ATP-binding cassette domain-containing protein [Elusimicrobia bacterium]|nr:ATP-binding cassette domain-containing protein [Elusimicrobiota bacterium]